MIHPIISFLLLSSLFTIKAAYAAEGGFKRPFSVISQDESDREHTDSEVSKPTDPNIEKPVHAYLDGGFGIISDDQNMDTDDFEPDVCYFKIWDQNPTLPQKDIQEFYTKNAHKLGPLGIIPFDILLIVAENCSLVKSIMALNRVGYTIATGYEVDRMALEGYGNFNLVLILDKSNPNRKLNTKAGELALWREEEHLVCKVSNKPKAVIFINNGRLSFGVYGVGIWQGDIFVTTIKCSDEDKKSFSELLTYLKSSRPTNLSGQARNQLFNWVLRFGYVRPDKLPDFKGALFSVDPSGSFNHETDQGWVIKNNLKHTMFSVYWYALLKAFFDSEEDCTELLDYLAGTNIKELEIRPQYPVDDLINVFSQMNIERLAIPFSEKCTPTKLKDILNLPTIRHITFDAVWCRGYHDQQFAWVQSNFDWKQRLVDFCSDLKGNKNVRILRIQLHGSDKWDANLLERIEPGISDSAVRILQLGSTEKSNTDLIKAFQGKVNRFRLEKLLSPIEVIAEN